MGIHQPPGIVASPDQVDIDWMTAALRAAGALSAGRLTAVDVKPVGNGLVSDNFRFTLTYDGETSAAPATVVGKFADPASLAAAGPFFYIREVSFYRDLAHQTSIITPRPYFANIDPESGNFALILEDLGPARAGDQLAGCSLEDAETAMLEAAALHAPFWNNPACERIDWLKPWLMITIPALEPAVAAVKDNYAGQIEPEITALLDRFPAAAKAMIADRSGPMTLQHGDFRLDNILFDVQGGTRRMGTLDWQTVNHGPGMVDVAYFLSTSLAPELRRARERELLGRYHAELVRLGVAGYDFDQCWFDFRRFTLYGVLVGVYSFLIVPRSERGDAVFLKVIRNSCLQALDHKTFDLWSV